MRPVEGSLVFWSSSPALNTKTRRRAFLKRSGGRAVPCKTFESHGTGDMIPGLRGARFILAPALPVNVCASPADFATPRHSFAPRGNQLGFDRLDGPMTRGLRLMGAAALVTALHLAALLMLGQMAPDLPQMQEGPIFKIVLAPPMMAARRRPAQPPEPLNRRAPHSTRSLEGQADSSVDAERSGLEVDGASQGPLLDQAEADALQAARIRAALRQTFGCSQPDMARLSETERAACLERFARGAESVPYRPPLMDEAKRRDLDRAGARKAADRA